MKKILAYRNGINHLNIQIDQLKLSRKTQICFQNSFVRVLTIQENLLFFLSYLNHADVPQLHKKCNKSLKENYRPVSILSILSKVFEKNMFQQMWWFFDDFFFKYQYGFRKGFNTQQCVLALLKNRKGLYIEVECLLFY